MGIRFLVTVIFLFLYVNAAFSQPIYKMPVKDQYTHTIKWIKVPEDKLKEYESFKNGAVKEVSDPVDTKEGLKKQITTWKKSGKTLVETRIYDPKRLTVQKGYLPVDIVFVTFQ